jgi:SET domain-containing protein
VVSVTVNHFPPSLSALNHTLPQSIQITAIQTQHTLSSFFSKRSNFWTCQVSRTTLLLSPLLCSPHTALNEVTYSFGEYLLNSIAETLLYNDEKWTQRHSSGVTRQRYIQFCFRFRFCFCFLVTFLREEQNKER